MNLQPPPFAGIGDFGQGFGIGLHKDLIQQVVVFVFNRPDLQNFQRRAEGNPLVAIFFQRAEEKLFFLRSQDILEAAEGMKQSLGNLYVDSSETARVFRICFNIKRYCLIFVERLETVGNDSGEMYEYILTIAVIGYETKAFI